MTNTFSYPVGQEAGPFEVKQKIWQVLKLSEGGTNQTTFSSSFPAERNLCAYETLPGMNLCGL